jgi:hypothetical protein
MSTTPSLSLPYVDPGTAAEQNHNQGLNVIDVLLRGRVISRVYLAPPTTVEGDAYIIAAGTPTGDWDARTAGDIAYRVGSQWAFFTPVTGTRMRVDDENGLCVVFVGSAWQAVTGEAIFAAARITSNQALGSGGTWTPVQWNSHVRYTASPNDLVFGHDTTTNPDQITLREAGDYEVTADVTIVATSTGGANVGNVRLTLNGTAVGNTLAACSVDSATLTTQTVTLSAVVTASAGDILALEGTRVSGSGTLSVVLGATRVRVRRV